MTTRCDHAERMERAAEWLELTTVDANQAATFESLLQRAAINAPNVELETLAVSAAEAAREMVPTARDAALAIAEMRRPAYCYLAFCGVGGRAQYVKIGMSIHPEKRLYGMATGSPLDCLWVYTADMPGRKAAYRAEQFLLRRMADHRRRGEWIEVGDLDAKGAASLARHLSQVLEQMDTASSRFALLGFTDGRRAA